MAQINLKEEKAQKLRDLAVRAAMKRGVFEKSGPARLVVLKDEGLMIGYRTPFNPLPKLSDAAKYEAAAARKDTLRGSYGVDVWLEDFGKVFSAAWDFASEPQVSLCRPGAWQTTLVTVAEKTVSEETGKKRKKSKVVKIEDKPITVPAIAAELPTDDREKLRALELENRNLRRAISGLMLDKLILAKAAAGNL